ncbi:SRPBCC domain-containing protein [Corynebacterium pacaense]|uniref:SRPBCC domain-containing protein n=1 Tax=Corynebacterium pacaense TaxID=1816684 RepID=UPI0009BC28F6|nr:SRPBCC domain-containing protein [Corynebacterium pacaense]
MPFPALLLPLIFWSALAVLSSWAVSRAVPLTASQSVRINAPMPLVWETITDIERYPEWNDHLIEAQTVGELSEGARFKVRARHPETKRLRIRFSPTITSWTVGEEVTWTTKLLTKWLLTVTQTIRLTESDGGATTLTREMSFTGALSPGVPFMISVEKLQKASNQKLKDLIEGTAE